MQQSNRCRTKYPIFLIHGTGFRDRRLFNYWGRIPEALEREGAEIHYGHQEAWGTIEHNAAIVKENILKVLETTGCGKVNLIAHSKGGLESRFMIHELGMGRHIASLTTISTPHHGSKTMDIFYDMPVPLHKFAALFVNTYFRLLGDEKPDFYNASRQFSTFFIKEFNTKIADSEGVFYQSYATVMKNSFSDVLMIFPHFIISLVEGENDGMVTPGSARWGEFRGVIRGDGLRGVSHSDIVDFRRRDFGGTDIRGIYIKIAGELKDKGF